MNNKLKKFLSDPNKREFIDGVLCGFILLQTFPEPTSHYAIIGFASLLSLACCILLVTMNKYNARRKQSYLEMFLSLILGITAIDLIVLIFQIIFDLIGLS